MLTITSLRAGTNTWDPYFFELLKHEYGVTRVTWEPPTSDSDAATVALWLVHWRSRGRGPVMPLYELVRPAAWHWHGAGRPVALRRVRADVLARLCAVLNEPRSGLSIVELPRQR